MQLVDYFLGERTWLFLLLLSCCWERQPRRGSSILLHVHPGGGKCPWDDRTVFLGQEWSFLEQSCQTNPGLPPSASKWEIDAHFSWL